MRGNKVYARASLTSLARSLATEIRESSVSSRRNRDRRRLRSRYFHEFATTTRNGTNCWVSLLSTGNIHFPRALGRNFRIPPRSESSADLSHFPANPCTKVRSPRRHASAYVFNFSVGSAPPPHVDPCTTCQSHNLFVSTAMRHPLTRRDKVVAVKLCVNQQTSFPASAFPRIFRLNVYAEREVASARLQRVSDITFCDARDFSLARVEILILYFRV